MAETDRTDSVKKPEVHTLTVWEEAIKGGPIKVNTQLECSCGFSGVVSGAKLTDDAVKWMIIEHRVSRLERLAGIEFTIKGK